MSIRENTVGFAAQVLMSVGANLPKLRAEFEQAAHEFDAREAVHLHPRSVACDVAERVNAIARTYIRRMNSRFPRHMPESSPKRRWPPTPQRQARPKPSAWASMLATI